MEDAMGEKELLADFWRKLTESLRTYHFTLQEDWEFLKKAHLTK